MLSRKTGTVVCPLPVPFVLVLGLSISAAGWAQGPGTAEMSSPAVDPAAGDSPAISWRYLERPHLPLKETEFVWLASLPDRWTRCLQADEADLNRDAAEAIVQAVGLGMPVAEDWAAELRRLVHDGGRPLECRVAAAQALVAMDQPIDEAGFWSSAADWPLALAAVLEPAAAAWDVGRLRPLWLRRVEAAAATPQPSDAPHPLQIRLAIEALGQVAAPAATAPLTRLLGAPHASPALRLQAATALGRIGDPAVVELAQQRFEAAGDDGPEQLIAIRLLRRQDSPETVALLERFADLPDRAVAGEGLRQLRRLAPAQVVARADQNITDRDANVRSVTVAALSTAADRQSVGLLAQALDDPVPDTRHAARDLLLAFARRDELRPAVIAAATGAVRSDRWRAQEQGLMIATQLQRRELREDVFALLDHERSEVAITAAWSIKRLSTQAWGAEVLRQTTQRLAGLADRFDSTASGVAMHLVETLGELAWQEGAEPLMRLVPKNAPYEPALRAAGVWSLGEILRGQPEQKVITALQQRLADAGSMLPEHILVRGMSAVTLAKMGSDDSLELLRRFEREESLNSFVGARAAWAVAQLTGQAMPEIPTPETNLGGWFVQPL